MFNWLNRIFGKQRVHFRFTDESGKEFVGNSLVTDDMSKFNEKEFRQEMSNQWHKKTNTRITSFEIVDWD